MDLATFTIDAPGKADQISRREIRLLEANARLLKAEQIAHVGHWEIDARTRTRVWSTEVRRIFGLRPGDAIPDFDDEANGYHPDDRSKVRAAVLSALRDGKDVEVSARVIRPCGEVRHVVLRGVCECAEDGLANRLFGTSIDATDLIDTQSKLKESEDRFRLFADSVADYAIYMLDADGVVRDWNTGAERIKGYARDEIVGRNYAVFFTDEDRAQGAPDKALVIARRTGTFAGEGWRVRKDGSRFRSSVVLSAMRDDRGTLIGFAKITRDITERAAIEEDLRDKTMLLDRTLGHMDQGLLMADAAGVVRVFNGRAGHLLGVPIELLASKPTLSQLYQHQCDRGEFSRVATDMMDRIASTVAQHDQLVYERERPDGTVVEVRIVPLPDGGSVRTFTDITLRKRAEQHAEHLAMHDTLTAMPNRRGFREHLRQRLQAIAQGADSCAVLCLDLDRFKAVNDTFGHPLGDDLLKTIAERLRSVLRPEDVVARIGGDEFAVLIDNVRERSADIVARALVEVVSTPFELNGVNVTIGISIGIAVVPRDGADLEPIVRNADFALYRAKTSGRNTYRFYDPAMDRINEDRLLLEIDLDQALKQQQFELHYQPIVAVADGQLAGFEALIRWRHPQRGLVAPGLFVTLAEETSLIVPIGSWVLGEACRTAAKWPDAMRIAVNVSAIQIRQTGFEQTVRSALVTSGLPPDRLELEITESVLMQDGDGMLACLTRLRALGIRIALDDFGTGYSSLSYLHRFPIDKIKIDKAFVQRVGEPYADDIVKAIVALGRMRGNTITAEGVETQAQYDWMVEVGCDQVQGFLVGKPRPLDIASQLTSQSEVSSDVEAA